MKSAASPNLTEAIPKPSNSNGNGHSPLRQRAANFWLNLLFRSAAHRPWIVNMLRPLNRRFTLKLSQSLRHGTLANARHILGSDSTPAQRENFAGRVLDNFVGFVSDIGSCIDLTPDEMRDRIESINGHEKFVAVRALKRGVIIITAHMGSFEIGTAGLLKYEDQKIHVVFRRDAFTNFEEIRSAMRKRLGVIESPIDQGWGMWMHLRDALQRNEVVMIQADRVTPGQKGQAVPFFDGHMLLPTGPVKLALASGAPILPVFNVRTPDGRVKLFIEDPIFVESPEDFDAAMLKIARVIERYVRQYPDQWLVVHPAWCEDHQS